MKNFRNAELVIVRLCIMCLGFICSGYAVSYLWRWFVVPVFPLVKPLNFLQSIGIVILFGVLWPARGEKNDNHNLWQEAEDSLSVPIASLAFGWIIKSIM